MHDCLGEPIKKLKKHILRGLVKGRGCCAQGFFPRKLSNRMVAYSYLLSNGNPRDLRVGEMLALQNMSNMYRDRK